MSVVQTKEIAAVVARAANQIGEGMDPGLVRQELAHWLVADEAIGLVRLLTSPRVRCRRCQTCVRESRASGPHCLGCAVALRREAEQPEIGERT